MEIRISRRLMEDITQSLQSALARDRIVNIHQLADEIRERNEAENVALEDIVIQLVSNAQLFNAAMEFDGVSRPRRAAC